MCHVLKEGRTVTQGYWDKRPPFTNFVLDMPIMNFIEADVVH